MQEDVIAISPPAERKRRRELREVADKSSEPSGKCVSVVHYCNGGAKLSNDERADCDGAYRKSNTFVPGTKRYRLKGSSTDLLDERVLSAVAKHTNWNPFFICFLSCLCKKTRAISDRHLWREFCHSRAPKMVSDLLLGAKNRQIHGGWRALGRLFLYCAGCYPSSLGSGFPLKSVAGHFVHQTRFSRTSGQFFLVPRCRGDVLYMSDPCEHSNEPEDVGLFRGVFRSFDKSETKNLLTLKRVPISDAENCPFCKAGVWNMRHAKMIPKSASVRLAAYKENVDYSVCLNGHVNGKCALVHLSDSDDFGDDD